MKKCVLGLTLLVAFLTNSFAQGKSYHLDSAIQSFCSGDTKASINNLKNALLRDPKIVYIIRGTDSCGLFDRDDISSVKADICVSLSKLYEYSGESQMALDYLDLADNNYLPSYGGCANGMIMYRTYLSIKYADFYLRMGDTTKAISRLLQYYMSGESYSIEVAQKLKKLLLQKYSQREINLEIEKAIGTIKVEKRSKDNEYRRIYLFTLFGHTDAFPSDNLLKARQYIKRNQSLSLLRS